MIHESDESGNPSVEKHWRNIVRSRGRSPMKNARKVGEVRIHGFDDIKEAMEIQKMIKDKGLNSTVTMSPGDFEFCIHREGFDSYQFSIKVAIEIDSSKIRELTADAIESSEEEFNTRIEQLKAVPGVALFADELIKHICEARDVLCIVTQPVSETINQHTEETQMPNPEENLVAAVTGKSTEEITSMKNDSINPVNETATSTTKENETMNSNDTTTKTAAAEETTAAAGTSQTTTETVEVTVTKTVAGSSDKSFMARHKKKMIIGGSIVAAAGLAFLGWKNMDKLEGMFSKGQTS